MGNTIWIEAQGRPGSETHDDMSVLLRLDKPLDALATKLGVTKLSDFYDYRELLENFGDDEEELPDPSWFDSVKGLETVKSLRQHLEQDFDELEWKPDESEAHFPQTIMDDLKFCESVLEEAVAKGQKFRLLIVP